MSYVRSPLRKCQTKKNKFLYNAKKDSKGMFLLRFQIIEFIPIAFVL